MDLLQIHNLVDWKTHLKTLRSMKEEGKIRYIGITHYLPSAYNQMIRIIEEEPLDFIQVNYSVQSTSSGDRLIPLAADKGIAVINNRPFEGGHLISHLRNKPLPSWSSEYGFRSWAQLLLRYNLENRDITCVIPGTRDPVHILENLDAGRISDSDPSLAYRVKRAIGNI